MRVSLPEVLYIFGSESDSSKKQLFIRFILSVFEYKKELGITGGRLNKQRKTECMKHEYSNFQINFQLAGFLAMLLLYHLSGQHIIGTFPWKSNDIFLWRTLQQQHESSTYYNFTNNITVCVCVCIFIRCVFIRDFWPLDYRIETWLYMERMFALIMRLTNLLLICLFACSFVVFRYPFHSDSFHFILSEFYFDFVFTCLIHIRFCFSVFHPSRQMVVYQWCRFVWCSNVRQIACGLHIPCIESGRLFVFGENQFGINEFQPLICFSFIHTF